MADRSWRSNAVLALCRHTGLRDPVDAVFELVDSLLEGAKVLEPPVDVDLLASLCRIREVRPVEMAEAGRLVPDGAGYVVQVNQRHPETKQRFTVAHEFAHTFFADALKATRSVRDKATGMFNDREEEEFLCDFGAARALLNPRWLQPLARGRAPSLDGLIEIAQTCQASLEATAIQLSRLGLWYCSFAFWEPGLRKGEASDAEADSPREKLRVRRVYAPQDAPFLPRNKSADEESQIWAAFVEQGRSEGEEYLDLGYRLAPAFTQSIYAPYYDEQGSLRPRVISCLRWQKPPRGRFR